MSTIKEYILIGFSMKGSLWKVESVSISPRWWPGFCLQMFQGGPSNRAEDPEEVADRRAYEDSRPPLSSYMYPEPVKVWVTESSYWKFIET